jgi:hypothetical protein
MLRASLVLTVLVAACNASSPPPVPPQSGAGGTGSPSSPVVSVGADVARVLDDWHDAAAHADEARYFGHFAQGAIFLGTDPGERWTVPQLRAYAHPHFAAGKAWTFHAAHREITFAGGVAWFDEDLDTANLGPARGSGVLVRDDGGAWKIAQYNLSIPIPNARFADVRAVIAGTQAPAPPVAPSPVTPSPVTPNPVTPIPGATLGQPRGLPPVCIQARAAEQRHAPTAAALRRKCVEAGGDPGY